MNNKTGRDGIPTYGKNMPTLHRRKKPLSVSPLKTSATLGASLAFLGIDRAVPLMHGAQGCTAFGKVFFVRHFREPIPLQTTAMDQVSSVMGANENIIEGLQAVISKQKPSLVGVPTTGLAETQGCDLAMAVTEFRNRYPQFDAVRIVPVNTPDYTGCFESGYAAAVKATLEELVPQVAPENRRAPRTSGRVNVLASSALTMGDLEAIKDLCEAFGLTAVVFPDLADSLDGHLTDEDFTPLTFGGTTIPQLETMADADATLVIGRSLFAAADVLQRRTGVPDFRFDHLLGLEAADAFLFALHRLSGRPVPRKFERQRSQLQDAMLDTHFMLGLTRVAIAGDPDLLLAYSHFLRQIGAEIVAAVASGNGPALEAVPCDEIFLGDLEDLELRSREAGAELLVSNSHAVETASRLEIPLFRAGFPQFDWLGGYQRTVVGYQGARQLLFDLANIMADFRSHAIEPYRSVLSARDEPSLASGLRPPMFLSTGDVTCPS